MQLVKRFERMLLHAVRNDGRFAVGTKNRLSSFERAPASALRSVFLCVVSFVFADPCFGEVRRDGIAPEILELFARGFEHFSVGVRMEEHVPFLIAGEGGLRAVRAADDDGAQLPLVEEVAFCMHIALVDARFDIRKLEEFSQRCRTVEIQVRRGEKAPGNTIVTQLVEHFDERLQTAIRDEGDGEVEACARFELGFDDRKQVGGRSLIVRYDAWVERAVRSFGFFSRVDVARVETLLETDDRIITRIGQC